MNDSVDDRIASGLRTEATVDPDPGAAHQRFVDLRQRRRRRMQVASGIAVVVVVAGLAGIAAARDHGTSHQAVTSGEPGRTTTPEPQLGDTTSGAGAEDSTSVPSTAPTTIAASGTGSGTVAGTTPATTPRTTTTAMPAPPPPPTTAVTTPPGGHQTITVTEADDGKSYTLHRGDTLDVGLAGGTYHWTPPMSSDENVLRRTGAASGTADGGTWASFSAQSAGHADVSSTGDPPCRQASPPCMVPSRLFQVHVTVVG